MLVEGSLPLTWEVIDGVLSSREEEEEATTQWCGPHCRSTILIWRKLENVDPTSSNRRRSSDSPLEERSERWIDDEGSLWSGDRKAIYTTHLHASCCCQPKEDERTRRQDAKILPRELPTTADLVLAAQLEAEPKMSYGNWKTAMKRQKLLSELMGHLYRLSREVGE